MDRIRVDVALPRGPEHYWRMMVELTRSAGGFTVTDIWQLTNSRSRQTIKGYVHHCRDTAAIEAVTTGANGAVSYRVVNLNGLAPVVRRDDFRDQRGRIQEQIWTTIRGLPQFTIRELAIEASTDEVTVCERAAKDYVHALREAGYLITVRPSVRLKTPGIFRLAPGLNTGPKAPAILRTRFVFDRNREVPMGAALGTAEDAA
ncbi:hypothetical protein [Methylobacterium sp. WL6]|uniref:hypothetical protein n=1 Tax=Methylobacterium sp. WL6 TaxID=2603901 RepID=UPI0011CCB342|nr:hypothetical protein [Methylobacterium sp. WL6]TXN71627.1 hypothetical protein FV230_07715 [Methylobacterium sp. WL6]